MGVRNQPYDSSELALRLLKKRKQRCSKKPEKAGKHKIRMFEMKRITTRMKSWYFVFEIGSIFPSVCVLGIKGVLIITSSLLFGSNKEG